MQETQLVYNLVPRVSKPKLGKNVFIVALENNGQSTICSMLVAKIAQGF
jgi:hypothetical protein